MPAYSFGYPLNPAMPYFTPMGQLLPYAGMAQRTPSILTNPYSARPTPYYQNMHQAQSLVVKQLPIPPSDGRGFSERLPLPASTNLNSIATSLPTGELPTVPDSPVPEDRSIGYRPPYTALGMVEMASSDTWDPNNNPLLRYYMPPPTMPAPNDTPPSRMPLDQIQRPPAVENQMPYYNNDPRLSSYLLSNEQIAPYPTYQIEA